MYGNREEEKRKRKKEERRCRPLGSKAQKNSVACHGAESTPLKFTLLRRSLTCARLPEGTLQNALLDRRRDIATNESISESGLDGSQNLFDIIERIVEYNVNC